MKWFLATFISLGILVTWFVTDGWNISATETDIPPKDTEEVQTVERLLFQLINDAREEAGLHKLEYDSTLRSLAQEHSNRMLETGEYEHSSYNYYENIFWDINVSLNAIPQGAFRAWMKSYSHRDNLLEEKITRCGIGVAKSGINTYVTFIAD